MQRKEAVLQIIHKYVLESDVRISAGSLFQTLILLNFIDISDILMFYFGVRKILLFLVL